MALLMFVNFCISRTPPSPEGRNILFELATSSDESLRRERKHVVKKKTTYWQRLTLGWPPNLLLHSTVWQRAAKYGGSW